ncbi:MAG TPA: hypothetical protein VN618_02940 [Solirubrobacteraceae bacterium]|nr:hypothetical protein [Solirubrobacteraceae bacterium]
MKQMTSGAALLCVIAAVVLPATAAYAHKVLTLESAGITAPDGSPAHAGLVIDGCTIYSEGTLTRNGTSRVLISAWTNTLVQCEEEHQESGTVTVAQLSAGGKARFKGKIEVTRPGPCEYVYTQFRANFNVPGQTIFLGFTAGKLNSRTSSETCESTNTTFFLGDASPELFGEAFEDSLA